MYVNCAHCGFAYFLKYPSICPMCSHVSTVDAQVDALYHRVRKNKRLGLVEQIAADKLIDRILGPIARVAQYPFLCGTSSMVNFAGRSRDPIVDALKYLKFGVNLPSSVWWQWAPTYEGASRLQFTSAINDTLGGVTSSLQMLDVPLGMTFLAPKREQLFWFKSVSTNNRSGTFGCIDTKVMATQQVGQQTDAMKWGTVSGDVRMSKFNPKPEHGFLDFSSLVLKIDLVDVHYLGDFQKPPFMHYARNLVRHLKTKTRHDVQISVQAEKLDVGLDWGGMSLTCELSGTADMNLTLIDEIEPELPMHRRVVVGTGDFQLKKVGPFKMPAWGFFHRKATIVGTKTPSNRMVWNVKQIADPAPAQIVPDSKPDKMFDFLCKFG
jgi:hypothetical protein